MQVQLRDLGRNIVMTLSRHLAGVILALLLSVFLARSLGTTGFGFYGLAILLPMLLAKFCDLGISTSNAYFLGRGSVSLRDAYRVTKRLWLALSIIGIAIAVLIIVLAGARLFPGVPTIYLWIGMGIYPILLAQAFGISLLRGLQDFESYNAVLLIGSVLTLVLSVLFVWAFDWNVIGALLAFAAGWLVQSVIAWWRARRCRSQESDAVHFGRYTRAALSYGWKSQVSILLSFSMYRVDVFLLNALINPAVVGIYIVATQLAERLWMLSQAVGVVILPRLAQLDADEAQRLRLTPLVTRWVTLLAFLGAAVMIVVGYPFIVVLYGVDYARAYLALVALLPGVVILSGSRILANDLAARGRPETNMVVSIIALLVNIGANLVLIPRLAIVGAALASTIAYSLHGIMTLGMYAHIVERHWWRIVSVTDDDRAVWRWAHAAIRRSHGGATAVSE
ncbi:MAG: flippase [Anaerolineae bacterium]|nr:flippase [Anaerolineae bacterium]